MADPTEESENAAIDALLKLRECRDENKHLQEECRVRSVAITGQSKQIDELIGTLKKVWQCSAVGTQPYGVARSAWDLAQAAKQRASDYIAEVLASAE